MAAVRRYYRLHDRKAKAGTARLSRAGFLAAAEGLRQASRGTKLGGLKIKDLVSEGRS